MFLQLTGHTHTLTHTHTHTHTKSNAKIRERTLTAVAGVSRPEGEREEGLLRPSLRQMVGFLLVHVGRGYSTVRFVLRITGQSQG